MGISTAIDESAVARVVGIKTAYKNLRRNGVAILPQRVAVFGQGNADSVFSTAKQQVTSALQAAQIYGFGSPIHLAVLQLLPVTGDGVGTIPVTVYPLDQGTAPAVGSITPVGEQVTSATYRIQINDVFTQEFPILADATTNRMLRNMHAVILAGLNLPVVPSFAYGTVIGVASGGNVGNGTITVLSAPGQPKPGTYILECTSAIANGGVFQLIDPDGQTAATGLTMTPGVGAATVITSNGLQFTLTDGTTDFAQDDAFLIEVPGESLELTSKWEGTTANDIKLSIVGSTTAGVTFTLVDPVGGLGTPDLENAFLQVGNVWETIIVNAGTGLDEFSLDAFEFFGEGRWGALTRKPLVVVTGTTNSDTDDLLAIGAAHKDGRVNVIVPCPESPALPFVCAARAVARIAALANGNPAHDYGGQRLTGIGAGADNDQFDYTVRNALVAGGISTTEVTDGVIYMGDTITTYHPTGDTYPAYRFVVDIVKLQNIIFNLDLIFTAPEWNGAPLIPDDQATTNRTAKKPKAAVAAVCGMIDNLALEALISDPATAKKNTYAEIDENNPKRLNLATTVQLSGNTNIKSIDLDFGYYFGTPSIIS